jgi:hypothetical protein
MNARPQGEPQQTATLVARAQRALLEARKLLAQREAQLKQQEQFIVSTHHKPDWFVEVEAAILAGAR